MKDGAIRTRILDGKAAAAALRSRVAEAAKGLPSRPGLALVRIGDDPASAGFVRSKAKAAAECGFAVDEHGLDADSSEGAILDLVRRLNRDPSIHGILVQLPLPAGLGAAPVLAAIDPLKDVDGLHPHNVGALWSGGRGLTACTPLGCLILLRQVFDRLDGRRALVVGRSNLVGRPMAGVLLRHDCSVTIAHSHTRGLARLCGEAEIVVAAAGVPGLIRGDWLAPGAVVIDVGLSSAEGGRLVGDVAFDEAHGVAAAISPVPGGVGPMTIAALMLNTLVAAATRQGMALPADIRALLPMLPADPPAVPARLDRLHIRDLAFTMHIGLHPHERQAPQPVVVNVEIDCERRAVAGQAVPVVCYEQVAKDIRSLAARGHVELVEDFADAVVALCLADPRVQRAKVRIEKLHAVTGTASVGVELERCCGGW